MRTYRYIEYGGIQYPARIAHVSVNAAGFTSKGASTTHTATIPRNNSVAAQATVTDDEGNSYKVTRAVIRLGMMRLDLIKA